MYNLEIYYPTQFNDTESLIAKTLLKYYFNFSRIVFPNVYESITDLAALFEESKSHKNTSIVFSEEPISIKYEGFFSRNKKIANNSDYLLCFSYFDNKGNCLSSGSKDTITKFLKCNSESNLIKVDIRDL